MKKTLLALIIVAGSSFIAVAQTEKADKLYNNWDYYGAAQLYQKQAQTTPTADVYFKLGECYRNMSNYPEALKAYDKVNAMGEYKNPMFYLYYGWMLKTSERYDDAKAAFQKYKEMEPADPRGKMYLNSCDLVVEDHKGDLPISVKNVSSLNTADADFCPVLYKGGIVFTSDRKNEGHAKVDEWNGAHFLELYSASSAGNDTSFGKATPLDNTINIQYHDGPASFSKNYDTIYFSRVDKTLKGSAKKTLGIERSKIYYAVMKAGKWSNVTAFYLNSDSFSVAHPCLSHDGSRLYFASDMKNGFGNSDIYYCTRDGAGWGPPVNAGPMINTAGTENYPALDSADNLYFSSDGFAGFGGLDICVSKLINGQYTQAIPLKAPLNSAADDFGMAFLKDGKTGYFSSNRNGGKGSDDIYYFDMGDDKDLTTSIYVIGYKKAPPPPPVVVAPPKADTVKVAPAPPPLDLHINFDVDKATLRADAVAKLNEIVAYLQKNTDQMVQINGYTDISGQEEYNQMLSNQRANAAAQYILSKGIEKNRVRTVGFGPHPPLLTEGIYDRVKEEVNRRVQFQWLPINSPEAKAPVTTAAAFAPAGYAIQITATMTELQDNAPDFKGVSGIYHIRYENGYYCYYYGFYSTSVAAAEGLKELSSKGVNGTIVGLSNKIK